MTNCITKHHREKRVKVDIAHRKKKLKQILIKFIMVDKLNCTFRCEEMYKPFEEDVAWKRCILYIYEWRKCI